MCLLGRTTEKWRQKNGPRRCRRSNTQTASLTLVRPRDAAAVRSVTLLSKFRVISKKKFNHKSTYSEQLLMLLFMFCCILCLESRAKCQE
ncbi:hypothetical protein NDU88_003835 [Pleurodeles waltl]|uniref:Uncharacterized protein n=1 Tax=Pleurodeles waltl TaxID=8319 RepID=A0AAV7LGC8_PLEWA|nr:hypothetical protein NDU88_003835 [Pleurodeles waltl]